MRKFSFRLQSLLGIKEQMEDVLKNKLSSKFNDLAQENALLNDLIETRHNNIVKFEQTKDKPSQIYQIMSYYDYLNSLTVLIENQQAIISKLKSEIAKLTDQLKTASKERQILVKLKEKEFEEYKYQLLKEEQQLIDGINSYKYYKKI